MKNNNLFCIPNPVSSPSLRLFSFPFAGGSANNFSFLQSVLDASVEVVLLEYPGRGRNFALTPIDNMSQLVAELLKSYRKLPPAPDVFFGHSLGALVAWEMSRSMSVMGMTLPEYFVASGCSAPHLASNLPRTHDLPDGAFSEVLINLEGTPDEVIEHAELFELLKPMLRADFKIAEQYRAPADRLPIPILAMAGAKDELVTPERVAAWGELTQAHCQFHTIDGGHFFVNTHTRDVVNHLNEVIRNLLTMHNKSSIL